MKHVFIAWTYAYATIQSSDVLRSKWVIVYLGALLIASVMHLCVSWRQYLRHHKSATCSNIFIRGSWVYEEPLSATGNSGISYNG